MTKTTARDLSELVYGSNASPAKATIRKATHDAPGRVPYFTSTQSVTRRGDSSSGSSAIHTPTREYDLSFQTPGKQTYGARGYYNYGSPGSPPSIETSGSPVCYTTFALPSRVINTLEPRFSVPRPADSLSRAAVSPPSPPLLPAEFRTQVSLSAFIEDGFNNAGRRTCIPPDNLGPGYYATSAGYMAHLHQDEYRRRSRKEKKLDKLIDKFTSCCSGCGALGHRYHMEHCRYATSGSQSYLGFTKCYKTR